MIRVAVHGPTVRGRVRADRGVLVLTGLVVALATAVLTAVGPLTVRTADRAVAHAVRDAGSGGAVVATLPSTDFRGIRRRDPQSVDEFEQNTRFAQTSMPAELAAVLQPDVASLTSPSFALVDAGPGRYLRLAYLRTPAGSPRVTWTAGAAPQASPGAAEADQAALSFDAPPWPVQVGLSERAAAALDVVPGDRLAAEDDVGQAIDAVVSGVYAASDPDERAWRAAPELLQPSTGQQDGVQRTAVAALVSPAALPDLRIAVPSDELTQRVSFAPQPERIRWQQTPTLRRSILRLEASPGVTLGQISWDSVLDRVLDGALVQISSARGQAQVLMVGLLATTLLTVVLAAQLLVRRRAGSLVLARERGASLVGVATELAGESVLVAVAGAALGLVVTAATVGSVDWAWTVPLVATAALAAPVLGAARSARATDARRVPANRAARRAARRTRQVRRLTLEATVVALAVVTFLALRQRHAVDGDLTPASAATWWAVTGALALVRMLPLLLRAALRAARRTAWQVRFFAAAQVVEAGSRALPLVVVAVAVAQLVLNGALATTERHGQESGALLAVGGDARLSTSPGAALSEAADKIGASTGVREAVAGRVADGVRVSSASTSAAVRFVVVDAAAYERLVSASALPDTPQLGRLTAPTSDGTVPALLLGGPAGLSDQPVVSWAGDATVHLTVVGQAPRIDAAVDPVVVVDGTAFGASGAVADPNTIWAVGPGASAAVRTVAAADAGASVATYDDVLASRRDAPLASALVDLAVAATVLLLVLAGLGVVLGAAADAPARAVSLGRLRALGLPGRQLRRVLVGQLLAPVAASVLTGAIVGGAFAAMGFGSLGLEQITGTTATPHLVVSVWTVVAVLVVPLTALLVAGRESGRLRQTSLARLLRTGFTR